jgi:hypothetical protein
MSRKPAEPKSRATALKITSVALFVNAAILFPFLFGLVENRVSFWDIIATINMVVNVLLIVALCAFGALHAEYRKTKKLHAQKVPEVSAENQ